MITDILSSDTGAAGGKVTVNVAALEVAITGAGGGISFRNAAPDLWFEPGDNIVLTGAWINVPFGLGQGTGLASITIAWRDNFGVETFPPELGNSGNLPFVNFCAQEFPPDGLFIACPRGAGRQFLKITALAGNVSMLNVPATLEGQVLDVQWHLRVNHTKALSAVP